LPTIPSDIESYLTPNELIVKIGRSRKWEIYLTDKRAIFKPAHEGGDGTEIVATSYHRISSVEYKKKNPSRYIAFGTVFVGFAIVLPILLNEIFPFIFTHYPTVATIFSILITISIALIGIILVGVSLFAKPNLTVHVQGKKLLTVSGELEEIVETIHNYRKRAKAERRHSPKKTKENKKSDRPKKIRKIRRGHKRINPRDKY